MFKSRLSWGISRHGIITLLLLMILALTTLYLGGCGRNTIQETQNEASIQYSGVSPLQIGQSDSSQIPMGQLAGNKNSDQANIKLKLPSAIDRKMIQKADIRLQVKDVPTAVDNILGLSKQFGGYTINSHIYKKENRVSADLSIKIPQQKLNSIIVSISKYGEISDKTITSQDVTEEYYDSEARLKVLTAKEERLLSLMNKASNIADIISIENELGKTRSEIEVLTGRLKYLSNATDYSQVNINLEQAVNGMVKAPQGTLGKASQGLISSLNNMINLASSLVVLLFILLPWVIILVLLFILIRYIYLKRKSRLLNE